MIGISKTSALEILDDTTLFPLNMLSLLVFCASYDILVKVHSD